MRKSPLLHLNNFLKAKNNTDFNKSFTRLIKYLIRNGFIPYDKVRMKNILSIKRAFLYWRDNNEHLLFKKNEIIIEVKSGYHSVSCKKKSWIQTTFEITFLKDVGRLVPLNNNLIIDSPDLYTIYSFYKGISPLYL